MNAEQVLPFVSKGCITWTMTTIGYVKYTLNLVRWLQRAGVPWTLCIICCDPESEIFFRREQIPCIQWKGGRRARTQDGMAAFGTPSFEVCNREKVDILKWFALNYASSGIEQSLYLDGDIVVQKDPWPLLRDISCQLAFQCDCSHEEEIHECASPCSGVIWTRHFSTVEQAAIYEINETLWKEAGSMDQNYIMKTLAATQTAYTTLDRRQFGNGVWQKTGRWNDGDWTLLHYNYMVSGTKRSAMKRAGHWLINH